MSTSEPVAAPTTASTRPAAIVVTGVIAAALLVVVLAFAFSGDNTGQSIDGRTATTTGELE